MNKKNRKLIEELVGAQDAVTEFAWIDPRRDIVVANWVRMKCMYGCESYGRSAACPPNTPTVPECRRFFAEYRHGLLLHVAKKLGKPDERHAWSKTVNLALTKLERHVFLADNPKAFLLFMDSCHLCGACKVLREECAQPMVARPSPESMAVDVFATVRKAGFPIKVLAEKSAAMNRFAFLLVE